MRQQSEVLPMVPDSIKASHKMYHNPQQTARNFWLMFEWIQCILVWSSTCQIFFMSHINGVQLSFWLLRWVVLLLLCIAKP